MPSNAPQNTNDDDVLLTREWFDSLGWIPTYSGRYRNRYGSYFIFCKVDGSHCFVEEKDLDGTSDGEKTCSPRYGDGIEIPAIVNRGRLRLACKLFGIELDQRPTEDKS